MAIEFEFYESPDPSGDGKKKYHARPVTLKTVTTEDMVVKIQEASSLTAGDVKAVLSALSDQIVMSFLDSCRIHLEGIGYFQVTLKTVREVEPDKTRAQSVWFKSVKFKPDNKLRNRLVNAPTRRSSLKIHSARLTNKQVENKVKKYFMENNTLTRIQLQYLCKFTKSMALKHIKRLLEEGMIENINTRAQPVYILRSVGL